MSLIKWMISIELLFTKSWSSKQSQLPKLVSIQLWMLVAVLLQQQTHFTVSMHGTYPSVKILDCQTHFSQDLISFSSCWTKRTQSLTGRSLRESSQIIDTRATRPIKHHFSTTWTQIALLRLIWNSTKMQAIRNKSMRRTWSKLPTVYRGTFSPEVS